MGTRIVFLRSANPRVTSNQLTETLGYKSVSFAQGQSDSNENSTLIFITPVGPEITDPDDAEFILLADETGTTVLADIINLKVCADIEKVDMGPRIVVFRVPGNENEFADMLSKNYDGKRVSWKDGVRLGEKEQTLISLTTQRLHQTIKSEDFFSDHILVDQNQKECFARLGREALFYLNHNLKDASLYEYRISLYDAYGNYEKHYQRLVQVFSGLETGLVLGEGWTKDYAHIVMSIMVYQIKLFSFASPVDIKKILIGLEYDDTGHRMADLDLYIKKRKVSWTEVQKDQKEKRTKKDEGIFLRSELMKKLPEKEKDRILELENEIRKLSH
jgi:hypothetical protein